MKIFQPTAYKLEPRVYFRLQSVVSLALLFCVTITCALGQTSHQIGPDLSPPALKSGDRSQAVPPPIEEAMPPQENHYDILSKILIPMTGVFFGGSQSSVRAMKLHMTIEQALGNLPVALKGATVQAALQYPDKIRIEAPLGNSLIRICRNGDNVWVFPGSKITPFLNTDQSALPSGSQPTMPLQLPITAEQAILLPALFQLNNNMEMATVKGIPCRALRGSLMTEFAKRTSLEDLSTTIWVAKGYSPKRIDFKREHFSLAIIIDDLSYSASLPSSTWEAPKNEKDIYRCGASRVQELLDMVMTSPKVN